MKRVKLWGISVVLMVGSLLGVHQSAQAGVPPPVWMDGTTRTYVFASGAFIDLTPYDFTYIGILDGNDAFGEDAGMACNTLSTATYMRPGRHQIVNVTAQVFMEHNYIGDLVIKLQSPGGSILPILHRPGLSLPDDGSTMGCCTDSSRWSASPIYFGDGFGPSAETMGSTIPYQMRICIDDGICRYAPDPDGAAGTITSFQGFDDEDPYGNWTLCVGDSEEGDVGTFISWGVSLTTRRP